MDAAIIGSIIAGGCGIITITLQKILDIQCIKNENHDGTVKSFHCIPKLHSCVYSIPDNNIEDVLTLYREAPGNWDIINSIYTKKTVDNNYFIIVPEGLMNDVSDNIWQGNVIWYREYTTRSNTGIWYLETELDYIKNNKYSKIFIKRFCNNATNNWKYLESNSEYISAINGRNSFEADSKIGHILEEIEITNDENNNATHITRTYECTHEQIGIIIYSNRVRDLVPPELNCFSKTIDIDNMVLTAQSAGFRTDLIEKISYGNTGTCLIKNIYIGEESLYIY
jgi:hypothetical protein